MMKEYNAQRITTLGKGRGNGKGKGKGKGKKRRRPADDADPPPPPPARPPDAVMPPPAAPAAPPAPPAPHERGPNFYEHPLVWQEVNCTNCNRVCGHYKYHEFPGFRDKPSWYFRVWDEEHGRWATKGKNHRCVQAHRMASEGVLDWIQANRKGCPGSAAAAAPLPDDSPAPPHA